MRRRSVLVKPALNNLEFSRQAFPRATFFGGPFLLSERFGMIERQEFTVWEQRWRLSMEAFVASQLAGADGAHGIEHVRRVVNNAKLLCRSLHSNSEHTNSEIVLPAAWLHDCVVVAKDSPLRSHASRLAATRAREYLIEIHYDQALVSAIEHAIIAHSFSAGIEPLTVEAKIVQDADRLEALGAIGLARCLMTAGAVRGELYDFLEPIAVDRELNDTKFAVDHFFKKLFLLPGQMQTRAGRELAEQRARFLAVFLQRLGHEANWDTDRLQQALVASGQLNPQSVVSDFDSKR